MPDPLTTQPRAHRIVQTDERLAAPDWVDDDWVIATEIGQPIDLHKTSAISSCYAGWRCAERRLHDLRHSAATALLIADVDVAIAGTGWDTPPST
jgi:hypothetical protein